MNLYGLSQRQLEEIARLVHERHAQTGQRAPEVRPNIQHVRITGPAVCDPHFGASCGSAVGVYYPGIVTAWDASIEDFRDYGLCWVRHPDDAALEVGATLGAKQSGNFEIVNQDPPMRTLFVTVGGSGSALDITSYVDIPIPDCLWLSETDDDIDFEMRTVAAQSAVTDTTTETDLGWSETIAEERLSDGTPVRFKIFGTFTTEGSTPGTIRLRVQANGTDILGGEAITLPVGVSDQRWEVAGDVVIHSATAIYASGRGLLQIDAESERPINMPNASTIGVGRSGGIEFTASAEFSAAYPENSITLQRGWLEVVKM